MVLTVCSLCGLGSIPSHGRVFKGFTMADQTQSTRPEQVWQEMAQSPLIGMKKTMDIEEEGRCPTRDRPLP